VAAPRQDTSSRRRVGGCEAVSGGVLEEAGQVARFAPEQVVGLALEPAACSRGSCRSLVRPPAASCLAVEAVAAHQDEPKPFVLDCEKAASISGRGSRILVSAAGSDASPARSATRSTTVVLPRPPAASPVPTGASRLVGSAGTARARSTSSRSVPGNSASSNGSGSRPVRTVSSARVARSLFSCSPMYTENLIARPWPGLSLIYSYNTHRKRAEKAAKAKDFEKGSRETGTNEERCDAQRSARGRGATRRTWL
jgi:hypothetical protein